MTEIIRMTSQMQPLEVGVPLYPFSHAGLFSKETTSQQEPICAPLPSAQSFEDSLTSPSAMASMNHASPPPTSIGAWPRPPTVLPFTTHQRPTPLSVSSYIGRF